MHRYVRLALMGLLIVVVQWLILGRLRMWGAYADGVLLFVAFVGIRYGRRVGAISGFIAGVLLDAVYNTWGLQMLVKTLVGFLLGLFPASERDALLILPRQAFAGGLVVSLVQNGILVTLLALQSGARDPFLVTALWLGSALYTAGVGTVAAVVAGR